MMDMHMSSGAGYALGGMHVLWWLLGLALVGAIVFLALGRQGEGRGRARETPHELLRRNLASGEITPQQYEQREALLDRDARAGS